MVLSPRIQAAGLLFLLLASLASGSVLPHQVSPQGLNPAQRPRPLESQALAGTVLRTAGDPSAWGRAHGRARGDGELPKVQSGGPEYQGLEAPDEFHSGRRACSVLSPILDSGECPANKEEFSSCGVYIPVRELVPEPSKHK